LNKTFDTCISKNTFIANRKQYRIREVAIDVIRLFLQIVSNIIVIANCYLVIISLEYKQSIIISCKTIRPNSFSLNKQGKTSTNNLIVKIKQAICVK